MLFLILVLITDSGGVDELVHQRRFLDAAITLRERAHRLDSSRAVREYTVLVTEFYAHQFLFRTFFMKNLGPGEQLAPLRNNSAKVELSQSVQIVEENFEQLLIRAQKKFSEDLEIKFAVASYVYSGKCCLRKSKIEMSPATVLRVFSEGLANGIESSTSLTALALLSEASGNLGDRPYELLRKARQLNPFNHEAALGFMNELLKRKDYSAALLEGRSLFEHEIEPMIRVDGLTGVARAFSAMGDCDQAMKAVEGGLKILPRHTFLWMIGLDCLRKLDRTDDYVEHISTYLDQDPESPVAFQTYTNYLQLKGVTSRDEAFLDLYGNAQPETDLAKVTRDANLGNFYLRFQKWPQAEAYFKTAVAEAESLENPPSGMLESLKDLLAMAQKQERP